MQYRGAKKRGGGVRYRGVRKRGKECGIGE